jgi:hypothetical protein
MYVFFHGKYTLKEVIRPPLTHPSPALPSPTSSPPLADRLRLYRVFYNLSIHPLPAALKTHGQ